MSQGQDWNTPDPQAAYQQPQYGQPPQGQGYPPAVYQQPSFPPGPGGYGTPPVMQVMPKNPAIALLISFFIPGVGSMYAGKTNTGVIILVCYIVALGLSFLLIGVPFAIGLWIWGMIDAYKAAQVWNQAHGIVS